MPLPDMTGDLLPPTTFPMPHRVSWGEVHDRFVAKAPFTEDRQPLFDALQLYAARVWSYIPAARLWIDGGFVTHKDWAAPSDADVVIVARQDDPNLQRALQSGGFRSLLTSNVPGVGRVQPMSGMIDGFVGVDTGAAAEDDNGNLAYWFHWWSRVTDQNKQARIGVHKGFVEVVRDRA